MQERTTSCITHPVRCLHYAVTGVFGKIYSIRRERGNPEPAGHRSLTAAKAANDFTRNCVLGFRRKLVLSKQKRDTGFRKVLSRHFAYLNPYFCLGIPVPLLRYGERYALFIPEAQTQNAAVRWIERISDNERTRKHEQK